MIVCLGDDHGPSRRRHQLSAPGGGRRTMDAALSRDTSAMWSLMRVRESRKVGCWVPWARDRGWVRNSGTLSSGHSAWRAITVCPGSMLERELWCWPGAPGRSTFPQASLARRGSHAARDFTLPCLTANHCRRCRSSSAPCRSGRPAPAMPEPVAPTMLEGRPTGRKTPRSAVRYLWGGGSATLIGMPSPADDRGVDAVARHLADGMNAFTGSAVASGAVRP